MVIIYHQHNKVTKVCKDEIEISFKASLNIAGTLIAVARQFPFERLIWCHIDVEKNVNWSAFDSVFHHDKIMASYNKSEDYFSEDLGYIDNSIFINVNRNVLYPTWFSSSALGGISAQAILQFENKIKPYKSFDYFLHSLSKIGMSKGLFCYSEPKLVLDQSISIIVEKATTGRLFQFVKEHYRTRWIFILLLNFIKYKKHFPLWSFLLSLIYKKHNKIDIDLDVVQVQSKLKMAESKSMDVIIPTIGRKSYLYDVLQDLAQQTHLPHNVIIVEQNPSPESTSELDYLTTEDWPFEVKHIFTHQSGACNARNVAAKHISSEWVFLSDDDIRFDKNLIYDIFCKVERYGITAVTTSCLQKNQKLVFKTIHQTHIFGSGTSFVKTSAIKDISFAMALEFGYGEDFDFGMQLRNKGFDVIYFPEPSILHLKAPVGGFRTKHQFPWQKEKIQPRPSPTIMYVKQKYLTQKQILGYKLVLFFKIIIKESPFKWFSAYKSLEQEWDMSIEWFKKL